jgi:hypothetical protein
VRISNFILQLFQAASYSTKAKKESEKLAPQNLLRDKDITTNQAEKGQIYDKRPIKFPLEAGKKYAWCACGRSKSQVSNLC